MTITGEVVGQYDIAIILSRESQPPGERLCSVGIEAGADCLGLDPGFPAYNPRQFYDPG